MGMKSNSTSTNDDHFYFTFLNHSKIGVEK